jgi:hypothetical protein
MSFEISLRYNLRNFLQIFFFFTDFVGQSNGWLNTIVHMIRFREKRERKREKEKEKKKKKKRKSKK